MWMSSTPSPWSSNCSRPSSDSFPSQIISIHSTHQPPGSPPHARCRATCRGNACSVAQDSSSVRPSARCRARRSGIRATNDCASGSSSKRSSTRLRTMPRLSRKNDPEAVRSRQHALGLPEVDLEPYAKAAESVTGLVSIPVSVAQLAVSLGEYELSEDGEVVETGRAEEEVVVPLAHTEGGLTASVQRGAKAIAESGGCRTYVIADRITRASCFICKDSGDALALAHWIEEQVPAMPEFLRDSDSPELSRYAVLREAKTHVVGPMCHVLWRFTTGDAFGANMMTRNAYALNMAYVLPQAPVPIERSILEANMGGDKKPSFEYFQQAHGTEQRVEGGLHVAIRFPGIEVGTVGGGTTLPDPKRWLELMGCAGQGKVYRLAQLVAATALALEISASAAMATAGSENFFRA